MDDKNNHDTYITDSNVDITISNVDEQKNQDQNKQYDPWPILIIVIIMIGMALYPYLLHKGIL